jgi:hypothetical protein
VEAKDDLMHCGMADESVVVIKSRPLKAGNSMEDKTEMTLYMVTMGHRKCQKRLCLRREEVQKKITGGTTK